MKKEQKAKKLIRKADIDFTPIISKKNFKPYVRKRNNNINSTSTKTNLLSKFRLRELNQLMPNINYSQDLKNYYQIGPETFRQKNLSNFEMKIKQNSLLNETINIKKGEQ